LIARCDRRVDDFAAAQKFPPGNGLMSGQEITSSMAARAPLSGATAYWPPYGTLPRSQDHRKVADILLDDAAIDGHAKIFLIIHTCGTVFSDDPRSTILIEASAPDGCVEHRPKGSPGRLASGRRRSLPPGTELGIRGIHGNG